jgi:hypothetical protein
MVLDEWVLIPKESGTVCTEPQQFVLPMLNRGQFRHTVKGPWGAPRSFLSWLIGKEILEQGCHVVGASSCAWATTELQGPVRSTE